MSNSYKNTKLKMKKKRASLWVFDEKLYLWLVCSAALSRCSFYQAVHLPEKEG